MSIVYKKFQKGGFGPLPKLDSIPPAPMPKSPTPWGGRNLDPGFRVGVPNTNDIKYGPGPRPGGPSFRLPTPQTAPPMDLGTSVPPPTNQKTNPWQVGTKLPGDRKFGPPSPKVPQGWKPVQSRPAGIIKYQDGGIKNPNAINTISPETRNAIFKARDESFANPESSEERYYKNFKPATGEAEFDPLTQLGVGALATQGIKFATQGANAIKNNMASNAAKKAAEQEYKIAIAKTRAHNAKQLSRGNMAPGQAWRTMSSVAEHYKPFYKKGGILYKKGQAGGTVPASGIKPPANYKPLNKNTYTAPGIAQDLDFGHVDQSNPGVYYRQGDNYKNAYGQNASLPGMVNTDTGSLRRGEYDAWTAANTAATDLYEFDDQDNITNLDAANKQAYSDFRKTYGDSLLDDQQFYQTYAQQANNMFASDPTLNSINYGHSVYAKPEGAASVPGQADYFESGQGKYSVNTYGYDREQMDPPAPVEPPVTAPVEPSSQGIKKVPVPSKPSRVAPGSFHAPKKGTSTRHLDKMRKKRKRQKGGLLY